MLREHLLDEVYAAIVLRGDYAAILHRLSPLFGGHSGGVLQVASDGLRFLGVSNLCPSIMEDYNREYYKEDVWRLAEPAQRSNPVIVGSKLVDPDVTLRTGFHRHVLEPHDIFDILNAKFGEPPGPVIHYTFYRPHGEVFQNWHAGALEAIGRHIDRAHRLRMALTGTATSTACWLDALQLTRAERRVSELIVGGRSNRDISEQIGITANTLKWHLRNIFLKAGVRSKAQMIARAHAFAVAASAATSTGAKVTPSAQGGR